MKIVCDTNILVSGLLFGGNCRAILRLVIDGKVAAYASTAMMLELERVLLRPKFVLTPAQVAGILETVRDTFQMAMPAEKVDAVKDDPDDNAILEAAVAANANAIVSGDRHLLKLGQFRQIQIMTPARFIEEFAA